MKKFWHTVQRRNVKSADMYYIPVNDNIHLSPFRLTDKANLIYYINDAEINRNTLAIPYPYTEKDADEWLKLTLQEEEKFETYANWVIRNERDELIGCIGRQMLYGKDAHTDEVGYWLARPYWGKGIMTDVVKAFCDYWFAQGKVIRFTAAVFYYNKASARVLEKAGFQKEGYLRQHYAKDGQFLDGILYAKLKTD
ncbi:MAG: GNAT family N-acetyltransferase [Saprospiraceae bacterium]